MYTCAWDDNFVNSCGLHLHDSFVRGGGAPLLAPDQVSLSVFVNQICYKMFAQPTQIHRMTNDFCGPSLSSQSTVV